ncbi:hypothetical protein JTF06_09915 [Desemzia sp. RIT804]|uniref:hypothetical protein n=1 Tax=Desemzia sp. RIT 804 TaxID=2810209 RepID=UPI001950F900|nr:hypothetical protein [Desemzia sp. RIT 804]MBM6615203.1 hypothetical protein [Desemzia sp. RIT 804]
MKKRISLLLIAIALVLLIAFLVNKSEQKKIPTLVNLSGITYVLTNEPYEEALQSNKVYVVQKKVDRYKYPENSLESNFLDVGTEIYLPKEATESIICYKLDDGLYVARENKDEK